MMQLLYKFIYQLWIFLQKWRIVTPLAMLCKQLRSDQLHRRVLPLAISHVAARKDHWRKLHEQRAINEGIAIKVRNARHPWTVYCFRLRSERLEMLQTVCNGIFKQACMKHSWVHKKICRLQVHKWSSKDASCLPENQLSLMNIQ